MEFTEDVKLCRVCVALERLTGGKAKEGAWITLPIDEANAMVEENGHAAYELLHSIASSLKNIIVVERKRGGIIALICLLAQKNGYVIREIDAGIRDDGSLTVLSRFIVADETGDDVELALTMKNGSRTKKKLLTY